METAFFLLWRALLNCFDDMFIIINEHLLTIGHKNPEYTINGKLGDRKGVESENGIKSAFRKAKQQGCKVVVLDFDSCWTYQKGLDFLKPRPQNNVKF